MKNYPNYDLSALRKLLIFIFGIVSDVGKLYHIKDAMAGRGRALYKQSRFRLDSLYLSSPPSVPLNLSDSNPFYIQLPGCRLPRVIKHLEISHRRQGRRDSCWKSFLVTT